MPEIDLSPFEVLTHAMEWGARAKVFGLMLWPDDEHKRFDFVVSNVRDQAHGVAVQMNASLTLAPDFSRLLHEREIVPHRMMLKEALQPVVYGAAKVEHAPELTGGQIAGQVLIHATHRLKEGHRNIGLNDCLARVSDDLRRDGGMNARPRDLKDHWHKYRSVAPLWASHLELLRLKASGVAAKPGLEFSVFLMRAETFRIEGESIAHRNAREPLLPPGSIWQLSDTVKECILGRSERT